MDPNESFLFFKEKARLTRAADKEAREKKAASERARREAARLAGAGGTSTPGGGGASPSRSSSVSRDLRVLDPSTPAVVSLLD